MRVKGLLGLAVAGTLLSSSLASASVSDIWEFIEETDREILELFKKKHGVLEVPKPKDKAELQLKKKITKKVKKPKKVSKKFIDTEQVGRPPLYIMVSSYVWEPIKKVEDEILALSSGRQYAKAEKQTIKQYTGSSVGAVSDISKAPSTSGDISGKKTVIVGRPFNISMVACNVNKEDCFAVINGTVVKVGDYVGDCLLKDISFGGITVECGDKVYYVKVGGEE